MYLIFMQRKIHKYGQDLNHTIAFLKNLLLYNYWTIELPKLRWTANITMMLLLRWSDIRFVQWGSD